MELGVGYLTCEWLEDVQQTKINWIRSKHWVSKFRINVCDDYDSLFPFGMLSIVSVSVGLKWPTHFCFTLWCIGWCFFHHIIWSKECFEKQNDLFFYLNQCILSFVLFSSNQYGSLEHFCYFFSLTKMYRCNDPLHWPTKSGHKWRMLESAAVCADCLKVLSFSKSLFLWSESTVWKLSVFVWCSSVFTDEWQALQDIIMWMHLCHHSGLTKIGQTR